jgi:hypothetical protein
MKRLVMFAALVGAFAVQPALAQSAALAPASAADADLLCAAWTANTAGKAKTEKEKLGLTLLMTYFIGRWEGATGRSIEDGLTSTYLSANLAKIDGVNADCMARASEFGQRLQLVGNRLQNSGNDK